MERHPLHDCSGGVSVAALPIQRAVRRGEGSGIANRTRAELEPLVGFFVNMLVLRTDLSGDPDFETLVQRVAAVCPAYEHQELPFEQLVHELQPTRDLSPERLFQTAIVMQPDPFSLIRAMMACRRSLCALTPESPDMT